MGGIMNKTLFTRYCSTALLFFAPCLFAQTNLLTDPDFENGGSAWTYSNGADRSVVSTGAEHGTYCQQMVLRSLSFRRVYQDVAVSANSSYDVSGYVRTSGVDGGASIVVFWFDTATPPVNFTSSDFLRADTLGLISGTTAWARQSATHAAPAAAVMARIYLLGLAEPDSSGTVWFDNMSFSSSSSVGIIENARLFASAGFNLTVTPNTHSGSITVTAAIPVNKMCVYDLTGGLVANVSFSTSTRFIWKSPAYLSKGVYLITCFTADNRAFTRQFILGR
jgi:hypothetical protein